MEHSTKAWVLIAELAKEDLVEVRRADAVGRDLAALVEQLGRAPSGLELEEWLEEHRLVTEVFAGPEALDEALHRHFGATFARAQPLQEARHPELEALIRQCPDSVEHYLVYSDWLQERSDPLGELIALGVAATGGGPAAGARFERQLKLHEERFLGTVARLVPDQVTLRWRHGLVHAVDAIGRLEPETWERLLRLRVCEVLQAIKVSLHMIYDAEPAAALLSTIDACAPETLRALSLVGVHDLSMRAALLRRTLEELAIHGNRATLPDVLPGSLERLRLRLHEIACPSPPRWEIRELDANLSPGLAGLLGGLELGRLERLTLEIRHCTAEELTTFLRTVRTPALAHLELRGGRLDEPTFRALARLPFARRLTSLGLTRLELTDEVMQALVEARESFESLAVVDVSNNELSRAGLEAARALAPEVVSRRQDRPGTGAHGRLRRFAGSRLQVAEKIADPKLWRDAGIDGDLLWARYRGTADYELFIMRELDGYGCSCPSSIQPCKHVVALALVAEKTELPRRPSGGIERRVRRLTDFFGGEEDW